MELHNQHTEITNWMAFIYGCIAGIVPWIVIMLYIVGALNSGLYRASRFWSNSRKPGFRLLKGQV